MACSGPRCQRHACLAQLRSFFEKAAQSHAQGLLLCPCAPTDRGCGERRRNTIAPSCALPSEVPNCLELRSLCHADPLCRCRGWVGRVGRDWHMPLLLATFLSLAGSNQLLAASPCIYFETLFLKRNVLALLSGTFRNSSNRKPEAGECFGPEAQDNPGQHSEITHSPPPVFFFSGGSGV
jgi:hypothetical protein